MNKKMICFGIILLCVMSVLAENRSIPVDVKVSLDFLSPSHFVLYMPNGLEKNFDWSNSSNLTPPDTSFTHTVYYDLDPEVWCGSNTALNQYSNLTTRFTGVLDICSSSMTQYNKTLAEVLKTAETDKQYVSCVVSLNNTKDNLVDCQAKEKKYDDSLNDYMSCQTALATCKGDQEDLATCKTDLTTARNYYIPIGLIGLIVGFLIAYVKWGKKKEYPMQGPSEQMQRGGSGLDFTHVKPEDVPKRSDGVNKDVWEKFKG